MEQQIRDRNGKTEQEFLRDYDVTQYFRPSVTVDAVLYRPIAHGIKLLMIKRGGHPYIGTYAFPGGFVEQDEPCETAVARELEEETGITDVPLSQLITASTPDRDPRWRNITVVYGAKVNKDVPAKAGDDAADSKWFEVTRNRDNALLFKADGESFAVTLDIVRDALGKIDINKTAITERGKTAFDHAKIIMYLLDVLGIE